MPFVPDLLAENPHLSIDLELSDGVTDLISRGMDVAIRIAPLRDSGLTARKLADNRRVLCAAPAYLKRHGRPGRIEDLARHDCITLSGVPHWPFVVTGKDRLIRVAGRFSSNSIEGIHEACVGAAGLALLSTWDVAAELSEGRLVVIDLDEPVAQERAIWAVYPNPRQTLPKVRVFLSWLQERLRS
jgi:DNA-binding transcriptional LysR family regulator